MSSPRYRYAHQQERERWRPVVESGDAYCAETICVMSTRWITPGSRWHLAHDPTGTSYIGVAHERCNTREGAARGNRMRSTRPTNPNRWVL